MVVLFTALKSEAQIALSEQKKIEQAITKACLFLGTLQHSNGVIADTINPLFDVWETVLATHALQFAKEHTEIKSIWKKALFFADSLSLSNPQKRLICHNIKCRQGYCIETSSIYYLPFYEEAIGIDTGVLQLRRLQQKNGSWKIGNPDVKHDTNYVSVTAFALWALESNNIKPIDSESAYRFIANSALKEGHWGRSWEYYNTPAYALWPILALKNWPKAYDWVSINALQYIIRTQAADGSWHFSDSTNVKNTSAELQTALMLNALLNLKSAAVYESIKKGIHYILSHQHSNGGWDGGFFPINNSRYQKKEYVTATALAVWALGNYLKNYATK